MHWLEFLPVENTVNVKAMLTEKSVSNCKQCVPHSVWLCFKVVCFFHGNFCELKVDALGLVTVCTCKVQSVPSQFVKRGESCGLHA